MNFFNPRGKIDMHGASLPHWQQDDCLQFITFRERDSLPQAMLRQWRLEKANWIAQNPEPHDGPTLDEYRTLFTKPIDDALDRGMGRCHLKSSTNQAILEEVLMYSQGEKVEHLSWVIMPNHVHLICRPMHPIDQLIKIWKGVSARKIGQGSLWQSNYRDTMIRNERHLHRAIHYIRNNPKKLPESHFTLWESDCAKAY
jgi:REP element-mobilizing transposase RayT